MSINQIRSKGARTLFCNPFFEPEGSHVQSACTIAMFFRIVFLGEDARGTSEV